MSISRSPVIGFSYDWVRYMSVFSQCLVQLVLEAFSGGLEIFSVCIIFHILPMTIKGLRETSPMIFSDNV